MKLTIALCSIILLLTVGYYYKEMNKKDSFKENTQYGKIIWPKGSYYEFNSDGDIVVELESSLKVVRGEWPAGTRFYYDADDLVKIEVFDSFKFADMEFSEGLTIKQEHLAPNTLHNMKLKMDIKLDGLDLHEGCDISFKNFVLYSGKCPEFDTVYFKRFIELPEVQKKE